MIKQIINILSHNAQINFRLENRDYDTMVKLVCWSNDTITFKGMMGKVILHDSDIESVEDYKTFVHIKATNWEKVM
jgi:hypothetical protein